MGCNSSDPKNERKVKPGGIRIKSSPRVDSKENPQVQAVTIYIDDHLITQNDQRNKTLTQLTQQQAAINPYLRCIGSFENTNGTGVLIAPNLVVTSFHNINGPKGENAKFKIYLNQSILIRKVLQIYKPREYTNKNDKNLIHYDFALLVIEQIQKEHLRWFKFPQLNINKELSQSQQIWVFGLPTFTHDNATNQLIVSQALHPKLYGGRGSILQLSQNTISYEIPTFLGQSGSPIFQITESGQISVIGLHKGKQINNSKEISYGIRMSSMSRKIDQWAEQHQFSIRSRRIVKNWKEVLPELMNLYKNQKQSELKQIWQQFEHQFSSLEDMKTKLDKWKVKQKSKVLPWLIFVIFHKYTIKKQTSYENQISLYLRILEIDPDFVRIHYDLADCYIKLDNQKKALDCYKKCYQINLLDYKAHYKIGQIELNRRNYKEAIHQFKKSIQINYQHEESYEKLIKAYVEYIDYSTKLQMESNEALIKSNDLKLQVQNYFLTDILIKNKNAYAYNFLGKYYTKIKSFKKAKEWFEMMLEKESQLVNSVTYLQYGKALFHTDDYKNAIQRLNHCLQLNKGSVMAIYYKGLSHAKLNKYIQALQYYQQACEILGTEDIFILTEMKMAYSKLNQQNEALECEEKIGIILKSGVQGHFKGT